MTDAQFRLLVFEELVRRDIICEADLIPKPVRQWWKDSREFFTHGKKLVKSRVKTKELAKEASRIRGQARKSEEQARISLAQLRAQKAVTPEKKKEIVTKLHDSLRKAEQAANISRRVRRRKRAKRRIVAGGAGGLITGFNVPGPFWFSMGTRGSKKALRYRKKVSTKKA